MKNFKNFTKIPPVSELKFPSENYQNYVSKPIQTFNAPSQNSPILPKNKNLYTYYDDLSAEKPEFITRYVTKRSRIVDSFYSVKPRDIGLKEDPAFDFTSLIKPKKFQATKELEILDHVLGGRTAIKPRPISSYGEYNRPELTQTNEFYTDVEGYKHIIFLYGNDKIIFIDNGWLHILTLSATDQYITIAKASDEVHIEFKKYCPNFYKLFQEKDAILHSVAPADVKTYLIFLDKIEEYNRQIIFSQEPFTEPELYSNIFHEFEPVFFRTFWKLSNNYINTLHEIMAILNRTLSRQSTILENATILENGTINTGFLDSICLENLFIIFNRARRTRPTSARSYFIYSFKLILFPRFCGFIKNYIISPILRFYKKL